MVPFARQTVDEPLNFWNNVLWNYVEFDLNDLDTKNEHMFGLNTATTQNMPVNPPRTS